MRLSLGFAEFPRPNSGPRHSFPAQRGDHALAANGSHRKDSLRKLSYSIEARKMASYETRTLQRFHHVIAVSEHDRDAMLTLSPAAPITVVPTGVDTEQYQVAPPASGNPPLVVFTGSMDWEPNIDAVEYFCREIWPAVLAAFPNARFQIVGRNPHPRVQRLASCVGRSHGNRSFRHRLFALRHCRDRSPAHRRRHATQDFRSDGHGKAVVSTSIGAEGLDVSPGRDLLIADDAPSFAAAILRLLREPDLRRSYEQAAAASAARFDWSQIARGFAEVLQETRAGFRTTPNHESAAVLPVRP